MVTDSIVGIPEIWLIYVQMMKIYHWSADFGHVLCRDRVLDFRWENNYEKLETTCIDST